MANTKKINAAHGIIYEAPPESLFGYFGWPTVAKTDDGTIIVAVSGFRSAHVCPWGKTVLFTSNDNGETWSVPIILNDTPLDDRDAGLLALDGNRLLASWFTSDTRHYIDWCEKSNPVKCSDVTSNWNEEIVGKWLGSFVRIRDEDGKWGNVVSVKVTTPHGPIRLRNGNLFYLGKIFGENDKNGMLKFKMDNLQDGDILAIKSSDNGITWEDCGSVAHPQKEGFFCEPHAIELENGKILGMLRKEKGTDNFSMFQTESGDGGKTWSEPEFISYGSPPHLLYHSSKTLICTYGYRREPFGQRVMFSRDAGATWSMDWIIRDDGISGDLGYPSTIELDNGALLSVYYQSTGENRPASVLFSKWEMPKL